MKIEFCPVTSLCSPFRPGSRVQTLTITCYICISNLKRKKKCLDESHTAHSPVGPAKHKINIYFKTDTSKMDSIAFDLTNDKQTICTYEMMVAIRYHAIQCGMIHLIDERPLISISFYLNLNSITIGYLQKVKSLVIFIE